MERKLETKIQPMTRCDRPPPAAYLLGDILENVYDNLHGNRGQEEHSIDPSMPIACVRHHHPPPRQEDAQTSLVMVIARKRPRRGEFRNGGSTSRGQPSKALQYMKVAETEGAS